jgi:hypothetical protein
MSKAADARRRSKRVVGPKPAAPPEAELPFGRKNYALFGIAALIIVAGYIALSRGSITLAPILLLLGYLVVIPWAIMAKSGGE